MKIMFFKIFRRVYQVITATGKPCPGCGGTNTDCENNIWWCRDCGKEFG
jgi:ribosomal protein L37AE/L43A